MGGMTRKMLLLGVSLALAACARSTSSQRADEAPARAFKTSLAVLLEHRAELALTAEQVDRFEKMDFTLHEKNIGLQYQLETLRAQSKKDSRPWHGGYMGGGTHDAHGGKGGSTSGPPDAEKERLVRRERLERIESTLRQMQDNDTASYMEAEKVLSDAQKLRARELFSQERETLLEQLEALHFRLRKGDY
jgi:hypothetical protein